MTTSTLAALATTLGIDTIRRFSDWGNRVWRLVGSFGLHIFNRFLTAFVCERDPDRKEYAIGDVPMLGIGLPSFIDGIIYCIAFTLSILIGYLATLGMVLHELPEGIITYLLFVRGGFSERKAMYLAFLAAAATTSLGMLVSYPLISAIESETPGGVLVAVIIVTPKA